jgi:acid stress-induced BolA-like protein IbaG/YrbA
VSTQTAPDLRRVLKDGLKAGFFDGPDDLVDVSPGEGDSIHVVVISRKLDGRRPRERRDLVWAEVNRVLGPESVGHVSLLVAASPEEAKSL